MRKEHGDLVEQVMLKRQELIRNLLSVLPVSPISENSCRIINIILPSSGMTALSLLLLSKSSLHSLSNTQATIQVRFFLSYLLFFFDDGLFCLAVQRTLLYTALGYVAQMQVLISRYLDVTLPFKLEHRGSESFIYREDSRQPGRDSGSVAATKFPLFHRGNEKEFRHGVDALNINLAYLCFSQSLSLNKRQIPHTLLNLRRLVQIPWLGRYERYTSIPCCLTSPPLIP